MRIAITLLLACIAGLGGCATTPTAQSPAKADIAALSKQVADTERAFAKTMADRDHAGFASFIAADTVFFSGPKPLHGKQAVVDAWKRFYSGPAPFSWAPETVELLDAGDLALSTGPVWNPQGKKVATFTSIWRQEAPGVWRIIFDKGEDVCDAPKP